MSASLLQCMAPSARSGSLPLWYVSCWKTATKCAPVMVWSTATHDDTSVMQCQTYWHYVRCHNSHTAGSCQTLHFCNSACTCQACTTAAASACCICNACTSKTTGTSCPQSYPCACTYVCNTQHSPCASPYIGPCLHSTQAPDPGTLIVLWAMRGEPWLGMSPDCLIIS